MSRTSDFNAFGRSYDSDLERGLALTGEGKDFYAEGRVRHAQWALARRGVRPTRVVDYGCGNGDTLPLLAQVFGGADVAGFEPSAALYEEARGRHPRFCIHGPGDEAAVADADLVYCNGVVHHVALSERGAFFERLKGTLRPGGHVALFENNPLNPGTRLVMRRIPFDRDAIPVLPWQLTRLVRDAGLEVRARHFLFFFPRRLRALRGLERSLRWMPLGGQYLIVARRSAANAVG